MPRGTTKRVYKLYAAPGEIVYTTNRELAQELSDGQGFEDYPLIETRAQYERLQSAELRARALRKLTPDERAALKLPDPGALPDDLDEDDAVDPNMS